MDVVGGLSRLSGSSSSLLGSDSSSFSDFSSFLDFSDFELG